jgi:transposase-like protein
MRFTLAPGRSAARAAFHRFQNGWRADYPAMVKQLERDLPELFSFVSFPRHLWRRLRTTKVIERVGVEVQRTRPMVCFVDVANVGGIIYSVVHGFTLESRSRTLQICTRAFFLA